MDHNEIRKKITQNTTLSELQSMLLELSESASDSTKSDIIFSMLDKLLQTKNNISDLSDVQYLLDICPVKYGLSYGILKIRYLLLKNGKVDEALDYLKSTIELSAKKKAISLIIAECAKYDKNYALELFLTELIPKHKPDIHELMVFLDLDLDLQPYLTKIMPYFLSTETRVPYDYKYKQFLCKADELPLKKLPNYPYNKDYDLIIDGDEILKSSKKHGLVPESYRTLDDLLTLISRQGRFRFLVVISESKLNVAKHAWTSNTTESIKNIIDKWMHKFCICRKKNVEIEIEVEVEEKENEEIDLHLNVEQTIIKLAYLTQCYVLTNNIYKIPDIDTIWVHDYIVRYKVNIKGIDRFINFSELELPRWSWVVQEEPEYFFIPTTEPSQWLKIAKNKD